MQHWDFFPSATLGFLSQCDTGNFRASSTLYKLETNVIQISLPEEIEQSTSQEFRGILYSKTQCHTGNFQASFSLYKLETNIIQISLPEEIEQGTSPSNLNSNTKQAKENWCQTVFQNSVSHWEFLS